MTLRDGDRESFGARNATVYVYANDGDYVELEFVRPFLVTKNGLDLLADWLRNEVHESVDAINDEVMADLAAEYYGASADDLHDPEPPDEAEEAA
jgi:hypothetical protein